VRAVRLTLAALAVVLCAAPTATASPIITLTGRGWGHGVGMAQDGAEGMARNGATTPEILAHFYPRTTIEQRQGQRIRVLLREATAVTIRTAAGASVRADGAAGVAVSGTLTARPLAGGRLRLLAADGTEMARGAVLRVSGGGPIRVASHSYRGVMELRRFGSSVRAIDDIRLEDYVRGVIAWEMPKDWHAAALGAQAVAARSYALAQSAANGQFDVFPDTRSQMYGGVDAESPSTDAAVAATANQVLTYQGRVATTFFFASSGGRTANVEDVWGGSAVPYLVSVPDPGDVISVYHRWVPRRLTATSLGRLFGTRPVRRIAITRNRSGRVARLTLVTVRGTRTMTGTAARTAGDLRSSWFSLRLLDLQRARRTAKGVHVIGRSSPDGRVGLDGLVGGSWVRLKTVTSRNGRVVIDTGTKGATSLRLRAGDARSRVVAAP
jgi:stage II sporulation protein D